MQCRECGADVPVLREFCPNCGAATHSSFSDQRREVRTERSEEELRANRKQVLIGGGVVLLALVAVGKFGLDGPSVHIDLDDDRPRGALVMTADDLARRYAGDPAVAAAKFSDREIEVSGEFLRIVPDGYGSIDARLKTANPDFPLGADLVGQSIEDAKLLRPGQTVTVSCRGVSGSDSDRWLRECAIQPARDATKGPSVPAPPSAPPPPPPPGGNSN